MARDGRPRPRDARHPAGKIRGPEKLDADMKKQIEDGSPKQAIVQPKKKHKLLVTDIQMYSGHSSIPHGNYMLELMAQEHRRLRRRPSATISNC